MTGPVILPATKSLPHAHRAEFGAWCADKLREARALGPAEDEPWEFNLLQLKASLRR